jgi:tRNASer (uridine44-2'-O)-methyltransferase
VFHQQIQNVLESSLPQSSSSDNYSFLHDDTSEWGSQDVAIAAFLMLLWKDMYPPRSSKEGEEEWESWGRPENGFIDLGCVCLSSFFTFYRN